jgi:hypothetical protein
MAVIGAKPLDGAFIRREVHLRDVQGEVGLQVAPVEGVVTSMDRFTFSRDIAYSRSPTASRACS